MDPLYAIVTFCILCCCCSSLFSSVFSSTKEENDKITEEIRLKKKLIADEKKATEEAKLTKIKADEAAEIARVAKEKADAAKIIADKFVASGSVRLTGQSDILADGEQFEGTTFGPINFPCPVRSDSSTVRYGSKGVYFKRNLPEGSNSFDLTDISIGGDPAPGENKKWFVKYTCV